jgi:hypothetical protein
MALLERLRTARGVARSLLILRRPPARAPWTELYARFVKPGDLVFDAGARR